MKIKKPFFMQVRVLSKPLFNLCLIISLYFSTIIGIYAAAFQNGSFENDSSLWGSNGYSGNYGDLDSIGSSEQDLTGWTISGTSMRWIKQDQNIFSAQSGTYYLMIGNPTTAYTNHVSQAFDTVSGTTYTVTYYLSTYNDAAAVAQRTVTVTVKNTNNSGTQLATQSEVATANYTWQQKSFTFTATSSTSYIRFANTPSTIGVFFVDNITITEAVTTPVFSNTNSHVYPYDPSNQQLKAIPNQTMVFDIGVRNTGGSPDASPQAARTFYFIIGIPQEIAFQLNSIVYTDDEYFGTATGNPATAGGTSGMNGSTMLCCGTSGDIEYSTVAGTAGPWSTSPPATSYSDGGFNYTNDVRAIRISPRGTFADGSSTPTGFRVYYMGQIK